MNIPNMITIGRFFFIPLFLIVFFSGWNYSNLLSFIVLIIAGLSDILDGYLARKNNQVTETGKLLDPLADKLLMIIVILAFVVDHRISWLAAGAVFFRDLGMIISSAYFYFSKKRKRIVPAANVFGKLTTFAYYFAFLMVLFQWPYHNIILWTVIIFSFITSFIYGIAFIRINREEESPPV